MRVSNHNTAERRKRATRPEVTAAIVAMRASGASQNAIARDLGVSQAHVCRVLRGYR